MKTKRHGGKKKTHSGAKKRVKITGTGKLRIEKGSKRHLLGAKSKRQKNIGGNKVMVSAADKNRFKALLPN